MNNLERVENYIRICKENPDHNFGEPVGSDFARELARDLDKAEMKIKELMNEKTTTQSDTPRTDALCITFCGIEFLPSVEPLFNHARTLERELNEANEKLNNVCEDCGTSTWIDNGDAKDLCGYCKLRSTNSALEKQVEELKGRSPKGWDEIAQERDSLKAQLAESKSVVVKSIALTEETNDLLRNERKMYEKASSERDSLRQQLTQLEQDKRIVDSALSDEGNVRLEVWDGVKWAFAYDRTAIDTALKA